MGIASSQPVVEQHHTNGISGHELADAPDWVLSGLQNYLPAVDHHKMRQTHSRFASLTTQKPHKPAECYGIITHVSSDYDLKRCLAALIVAGNSTQAYLFSTHDWRTCRVSNRASSVAVMAIIQGRVEDFELFLRAGFPRYNALTVALEHKNLEAVNLLMKYGCSVTSKDVELAQNLNLQHLNLQQWLSGNMDSLLRAAQGGQRETVADALEQRPQALMMQNQAGRTLLHAAAELGQVEVMQLLLDQNNFDILVQQDKQGLTPLHLCEARRCIDLLLKVCGERCLNIPMIGGTAYRHLVTPVLYQSLNRVPDAVMSFIAQGAYFDKYPESPSHLTSPLDLALRSGWSNGIRYMMAILDDEQGGQYALKAANLYMAYRQPTSQVNANLRDMMDLVLGLPKANKWLKHQDAQGKNVLMTLVNEKPATVNLPTVRLALERGAAPTINWSDQTGKTALLYAIDQPNSDELVALLKQYGAN